MTDHIELTAEEKMRLVKELTNERVKHESRVQMTQAICGTAFAIAVLVFVALGLGWL